MRGKDLDIREFSTKFMEATQHMSSEERASLMKMFENISKEIIKEEPATNTVASDEGDKIPDGITERLVKLKEKYQQ